MLHAPSATSKVAFFFYYVYYALMVGSYRLRMDTDAEISEGEVGSHMGSVDKNASGSCTGVGKTECLCLQWEKDDVTGYNSEFKTKALKECGAWNKKFDDCGTMTPEDCGAAWCYVDPAHCNLDDKTKSDITTLQHHGKKVDLHYSYKTCEC
eukprot:TRINITY_DN2347_c0_g1_i5.p1 TRINITY_DN2347_c0_g1~~TRINITY_DN2347_c0_g1_i5.p1  ORF type:complete len:152 (-),score=17.39 TRINITY_DN2347_c0_g1_i5:190-645(-)